MPFYIAIRNAILCDRKQVEALSVARLERVTAMEV